MNRSFPSRSGFEKWRMMVVYIIILLVFGFFMIRLFSLQIINGAAYLSRADENRTQNVNVPT